MGRTMKPTRSVLIGGALGLALVLASAVYLLRAPLVMALAPLVAQHRLAIDTAAGLPDGLHVGLCGSGSPFPDESRAGPCTLVLAGTRLFVFDAGGGATRNIGRMGFNHGKIDAVFLTHFHSDHIDGLGELLLQRWVAGSHRAPLPVYGPVGVTQVVDGLMQVYRQDQGYRVAHHGDTIVPASGFGAQAIPFTPDDTGEPLVLLRDGDLEISAFTVDHAPVHPAVGYRIRYKGRTVVLSGDTKQSAAVQRAAAGADLLLHDALSEPMLAAVQQAAQTQGRANLATIFHDIADYHSTPAQAAETARDARVRFLLLNHIVPPLPLPGMEAAFLGNAPTIFSGPLRVGHDGDLLSLPAGSTEVTLRSSF
jgi:ribonuclease Z